MRRLRTLSPLVKPLASALVKQAPKRADPELLTPEHRRFRQIVCDRAGWRCEWIEDGIRCGRRAPEHRMIADHIVERADGGALYDPANGCCLCTEHNTRKGIAARRSRAIE